MGTSPRNQKQNLEERILLENQPLEDDPLRTNRYINSVFAVNLLGKIMRIYLYTTKMTTVTVPPYDDT